MLPTINARTGGKTSRSLSRIICIRVKWDSVVNSVQDKVEIAQRRTEEVVWKVLLAMKEETVHQILNERKEEYSCENEWKHKYRPLYLVEVNGCE